MEAKKKITANLYESAVRRISCVLKDDKIEKALLQSLYSEKKITRAYSIGCRGFSSIHNAVTKQGCLPEAYMGKLVHVVVAEADADELFEFICRKIDVGKPGVGAVFMGPLLGSSVFALPQGVPDEE